MSGAAVGAGGPAFPPDRHRISRRRRPGKTCVLAGLCAASAAGLSGALSAQSSAITGSSDPPPSAPVLVTATATSSTGILVDWAPVTDAEGGVANYRVYRDGTLVATPTGLTFQDSGLQPGTTYGYVVSAVDSKGREGARSSPATATTPGSTDSTPPTAPTGLQASAPAPDRVDLDWQPASDPESGIGTYRVYRDGVFLLATGATSITDGSVQARTGYSYEVSAVNGAGLEGSRSNVVTVTTPAGQDATPPTAPTGLQATVAGPRHVDLAWQAASDPESGVSTYRVYRNGAPLLTTSALSHADVTAEPETTYLYEVSAVNGDGVESGRSAPVSATTPAEPDTTPPAPPQRLRIVGTPG